MRKLIIAIAIIVASPAFAESDNGGNKGTFAGQSTRGSAVKTNTQTYDNYGQAIASDQALRGVRDVGVQDYSIGLDTTVGYGRNGK